MLSTRAAYVWVLVAGAVRALVAWRTVVPSHDAAFFLWAAEEVAEGRPAGAFEILFQPLFPLLVAGPVAFGLDSVFAGQLVSCGLGALAILPLFAMTRDVVSRPAAHVACALYAFGLWFCRHPAAGLSEGPFYLFVALAARCILGDRPVRGGVTAALAYATRPEGAIVLLLSMRKTSRAVKKQILAFTPLALLMPAGFWMVGRGFVLTPKSSFVWEEGIGGIATRDGGWAAFLQYFENLVRNVGVSFEAIGYLVFPLAIFGFAVRRDSGLRLLFLVFTTQLLVASVLRSHVRFPSGFGVLLLPVAAAGVEHLRPRRLWSACLMMVFVLLPDLARLPYPVNAQRSVLVPLGAWLQPLLGHDGALATDLVRLEFFAGQRPWLPRRIRREEFLARCRAPGTRFVVFLPKRGQLQATELVSLGYRPAQPPSDLVQGLRDLGMVVYRR